MNISRRMCTCVNHEEEMLVVSHLMLNDSFRLTFACLSVIFFQVGGISAGLALYALANSWLNFAITYFQ